MRTPEVPDLMDMRLGRLFALGVIIARRGFLTAPGGGKA
jgi:hypothetical protein